VSERDQFREQAQELKVCCVIILTVISDRVCPGGESSSTSGDISAQTTATGSSGLASRPRLD
jgi:hypothetical protein